MKKTIVFILVIAFASASCKNPKLNKSEAKDEKSTDVASETLFKLEVIEPDNYVRITPPENSNFEISEDIAKTEPFKFEDFNGDGKEDVLIFLGACGTGGCEYGLFLNQHDDYYKLTFKDYLKGPEFFKESDNSWSIRSYEEVKPYDPSELHVSVFKFDEETYLYELDTAYIFYDTLPY